MSEKIALFDYLHRQHDTEGQWYCGVDFANDVTQLGVCLIHDNATEEVLTVHTVTKTPPTTNGTKSRILELLSDSQVLKKEELRQCKRFKNDLVDFLLTNQDFNFRSRFEKLPFETVKDSLAALLEKVGFSPWMAHEQPPLCWSYLFDAVGKFGRWTKKDHKYAEANYIEFIVWLIKKKIKNGNGIRLTAVDSPLGTCKDFLTVLKEEIPESLNDSKLKERKTEKYWRSRLSGFATQLPNTTDYFHRSRHLKSSAGLEIVPECIYCLLKSLQKNGLKKARLGTPDAIFIEAAPRVFLYSIIERVRCELKQEGNAVPDKVVEAVRDYKEKSSIHRETVYRYVVEHVRFWTGMKKRSLELAFPEDELFRNDHLFDAWLAGLTAWAHAQGETSTYLDAGLDPMTTEAEGHIISF